MCPADVEHAWAPTVPRAPAPAVSSARGSTGLAAPAAGLTHSRHAHTHCPPVCDGPDPGHRRSPQPERPTVSAVSAGTTITIIRALIDRTVASIINSIRSATNNAASIAATSATNLVVNRAVVSHISAKGARSGTQRRALVKGNPGNARIKLYIVHTCILVRIGLGVALPVNALGPSAAAATTPASSIVAIVSTCATAASVRGTTMTAATTTSASGPVTRAPRAATITVAAVVASAVVAIAVAAAVAAPAVASTAAGIAAAITARDSIVACTTVVGRTEHHHIIQKANMFDCDLLQTQAPLAQTIPLVEMARAPRSESRLLILLPRCVVRLCPPPARGQGRRRRR